MASIRVRQWLYEQYSMADLLATTTDDPSESDIRRHQRDRFLYLMDMARQGATDKEVMVELQNTPPLRRVARPVEV